MSKELTAISGISVKHALGFFFDGCHKIYVAETPADIAVMQGYWDDVMHPMSAIEETFKGACPLRFISWVNLEKPHTIVPQCAKRVTFKYTTGKSVVRFN